MLSAPRFVLPLLLLCLTGLAPAAARAENEGSTTQARAEALQVPAGKFIQSLGDRVIGIISKKDVTPAQRDQKFREILRTSFDLPTIGRFVIGRSWHAASAEQQKEYMNLFEELVVKTYGDRLTIYTGEGFEVTKARPEGDKDFIVNSQITRPDGSQPTSVDWRVRQKDGKLGVIDVVVEGVSLSVTQRQEYASVIQRNGGQIDPLLDLMRQQLKDPAVASSNGKPG